MKIHSLKVSTQFWQAMIDGRKPFDVRRDDRDFTVGDVCELRHYDPSFGFYGGMDHRTAKRITYILRHEDLPAGVPVGFVVLGFGETEI